MSLQESFSRVTNSVPYGFTIPKPNRYRNCGKTKGCGKGFASKSLPMHKRKQINARGGYNAHNRPKHLRCHEFTSAEARHHALIRWGKIPRGTPFVEPVSSRKA